MSDTLHTTTVAGRDTTANCLTWVFYEMYHNPEKKEKLQKEIDEVLQGQEPTYEDISNRLPYLHAFVQETLRLHPSVPKVRGGEAQDVDVRVGSGQTMNGGRPSLPVSRQQWS